LLLNAGIGGAEEILIPEENLGLDLIRILTKKVKPLANHPVIVGSRMVKKTYSS
jgi:hypothetical protein